MKKTIKITLLTLLLITTLLVVLNTKSISSISWSIHENRLTVYSFSDGQPCITQTKDGKIWILWSRSYYENETIVYTTSSNYGTTWKNETTLVNGGHNTHPSIIQAEDGTLWLVWSSDRPIPPTHDFGLSAYPSALIIQQNSYNSTEIIVESLNGFQGSVNLTVTGQPPDVITNLNPPQVIIPQNDQNSSILNVTVGATEPSEDYDLTVHGTSGELYHKIDIQLEIIESPTTGGSSLPQTGSKSPSQSTTNSNYDLYYKTSSDLGATWSNDTKLTFNPNDDLSPCITQAKNGTIWMVWASDRTGNHEIYYKTYNGDSWSNYTQLTNNTWHDKLPSITQTKDGKIWLTWASMETGNYEIYCKTYNGTSWSNNTRLTFTTDNDMSPTILQTIDDIIWVFWSSRPTMGTNDLYYMYLSDNGLPWSAPFQFTTDNCEDSWPSITQTSDTAIWVVWTSNRGDQPNGNYDIYYRISLVGDLNEDGIVDIEDLTTIASSFGTFSGNENWNPNADINKDNCTDIEDLNLVARNFGAN